MHILRSARSVVAMALVVAAATAVVGAQRGGQRIRVGTVVPDGSLWHETLQYMAQEWRRISDGAVEVRIFAGGALGDEADMVRKVRLGTLEAVALSSVGLARIDQGVACLQIPLLIESYAELDYVRDRIAPMLEARIETRDFKVLNWADGGWVHAFTKDETHTPDDLRGTKLFISAGDPESESLYKSFGFNVVPLSLVDLVTSLQTGMIDAVPIVPLFAQLQELHKLTPHMLDVRLLPLVGGTVMSARVWARLPAEHREAMLEAAHRAGSELRGEIRQMDTDSITEMSKRGLTVNTPDAATRRAWTQEMAEVYPRLRGDYCPADIYDEVLSLRDEYRASR
ncbi:MAG: TRAP transporter substrate-binding protein DctP [Dehalococcoidia bacterium]|jgi:TRAP-type C4-dicarboxylate transport system substrate-binding protein|nr:TRAP transporter substrate-binding protein DctP [Dehalococcoidia bacterium]